METGPKECRPTHPRKFFEATGILHTRKATVLGDTPFYPTFVFIVLPKLILNMVAGLVFTFLDFFATTGTL